MTVDIKERSERELQLETQVAQLQQLLTHHGICDKCRQFYSHDYTEPFAHCGCGTSEWYELTPHMKAEQRFNKVKSLLQRTEWYVRHFGGGKAELDRDHFRQHLLEEIDQAINPNKG